MVAALLILAAIAVVGSGYLLERHLHAHRTVRRAAARHGWDEERQVHEIRACKRRHGLRAKLRRRRR